MSHGRRFLAGLVSGVCALAVSFLLRRVADGVFIPELGSLTLFSLTLGVIESKMVETLGPAAKYSAFAGAIIIVTLLYGLLAMAVFKLSERLQASGYLRVMLLSSGVSLLLFFAIFAVVSSGAEVVTQPISSTSLVLSMLAPQLVYGFIMGLFHTKAPLRKEICIPVPKQTAGVKRRLFMKQGSALLVRQP